MPAIVAEGGRRGEIYPNLDASETLRATRSGRVIREFPVASPATRTSISLLPEKGFNVARALVGTEGTRVTVLGGRVSSGPEPARTRAGHLGYRSVFAAADAVPEILEFQPIGLEGMDELWSISS